MAYNQRTQYPKSYVKVADIDASNGATAISPNPGAPLSHIVFSSGAATTRIINVFEGTDAATLIERVTLRAGTSLVVRPHGRNLSGPDGYFLQDNDGDVTGIHATLFFYD